MKKLFTVTLFFILGFYGLSFAFNEFSYENAKSLARDYISNSSFDENWKDTQPYIFGKGKYFYTDSDSPSYVEFKVSCDKNPDCGFIMVNFDGDDVSIPIASTYGNAPSEILAIKNRSDIKDNKLYYFNPFEQYAENKVTGNISSIDPQDDYGNNELSSTGKILPDTEKNKKKNKELKDKIIKSETESKNYKNSGDFKFKKKELKDKKQTNGKDEIGFKYLDMAMADTAPTIITGYTSPGTSNIFTTGSNLGTCGSRTPCYNQFTTIYKGLTCLSGCSPTAMGIIFGYYDRTYSTNLNYNNLLPGTTTTFLNDTTSNSMIKKIGDYMLTFCTGTLGATYPSNYIKGIQYAKDRGYLNSTGSYITGTTTALFSTIKTEINAGRPVMVNNQTHSMVAYGYNSTTGLPIIRLNMGWGALSYITGLNGVKYKNSNIDYNMSAMFYNGVQKTPISNIVTIKVLK